MHEIPQFEVGIYQDMVNSPANVHELSSSNQQEELDQVIEDIEEIAQSISTQNEPSSKRNRTTEDISQGKRKNTRMRTDQTTLEEASGEDSDAEPNTKKILNSTMLPPTNPKQPTITKSLNLQTKFNNEITHYMSVPETPNARVLPPRREPTIPETPEVDETRSKILEHPASWNDESNNQPNRNIEKTYDDSIIAELKTKNQHHG